jgi:Protein of unknown function (DUF4038)/Putative collagen-binding domain of a collagenase
LLVGDAAWSAIAQLSITDMDTYLADRASRGFNCVLVNLFEHYFSTNAPNNIDNDSPFTGTVFQSGLGSNYMTRADYFITKAQSLGIYVLFDISYLGYPGTEEGWDTEIGAASTGQMQTIGEALGQRYVDYDNIIWVIGGDNVNTGFMTKLAALANGVLNYDTRHFFTTHEHSPEVASTNNGSQSWFGINNMYDQYPTAPSIMDDAYAYSPTLPFFQIEGWYENEHSTTAQNLRAEEYWAILEGSCGFIFGNSPIWKFAYDGGDWGAALSSQGSQDQARMGTFFNSLVWQTLAPDSISHNVLTAGYGTRGSEDFAPCGYAADGNLAVIYMPSNRTMTIDMSKFSGTITARWFDPTDGSYVADAASPLSNTGTHNFSRSGANSSGDHDWILLLEVG